MCSRLQKSNTGYVSFDFVLVIIVIICGYLIYTNVIASNDEPNDAAQSSALEAPVENEEASSVAQDTSKRFSLIPAATYSGTGSVVLKPINAGQTEIDVRAALPNEFDLTEYVAYYESRFAGKQRIGRVTKESSTFSINQTVQSPATDILAILIDIEKGQSEAATVNGQNLPHQVMRAEIRF